MERKEGRFTYNGTAYDVIDLPGSYSLSAGSDEEKITADYIRSGRADLVAILVDSSQLERPLYMYTDFIGTNILVVLVLNLMDVGYMARISVVFNSAMERLGLQGKSVCSLLMSMGCNMAGVAGSRVIAIVSIVFYLPCTMTVAATFRENHSKKWIAFSVVYYLVFSLALAFIFYHIGLLIWH